MNYSDYPSLQKSPNRIHLDVSSSFPIHKDVIRSVNDAMLVVCSPGKLSCGDADTAQDIVDNTRSNLARFLGVDDSEIYFCYSATQAIKDLVQNLANDITQIVASDEDHSSNFKQALSSSAEVLNIKYSESGAYDLNPGQRVSDRSLFIATHVHQLYGADTGFDKVVDELKPWAVALDISQSVSRMPINLGSMPADIAYFSGQKVGGIAGVGVIYIKNSARQRLFPKYGKSQKLKELLEPNTLPLASIASLNAGIKVLQDYGMERIAGRLARTTQDVVLSQLFDASNVKLSKGVASNMTCDGCGIVSFSIEGYSADEIGFILNDYGINVRAGDHCTNNSQGRSLVRMSWHVMNDEDQLQKLIDVIKSL